jgi:PAS domain S-box-containing protein
MNTGRILIVDDNGENLHYLRVLLQGGGYSVMAAENGADALKLAIQDPPALIISDILMPVMDGFSLCREWRKNERLMQIPFVFYTATYTDDRDREFALSLGADRFLVKPQEPEALISMIREILQSGNTISSKEQTIDIPEESSAVSRDQDDLIFLRQYNEALIRKMEDKVAQLEEANRRLEQDLLELQKREIALQESERRFELIAETIDEIIWVYDYEKAAVTYISPSHDRVWGYSRDRFLADSEFAMSCIHPEDRDLVIAANKNIESGQPIEYEHRIIRPDGTIRYLRNHGYPVRNNAGQVKQYVGVGQDVTSRKRAEEDLRASREYFRKILDSIGDAIFIKDQDHRFVLANASMCAFAGKSAEELLGKTGFHDMPKDMRSALLRYEDEVLNTGRECVTEQQIPDWRGNTRTLMSKMTQLTDLSGQRQVVGVIRDITEYKRLQAQFLQSQKMEAIGLLAGGIAHDFNNLLNVINGYCELLLEDISLDDPKRGDLGLISQAGKRAASLTSQLLAFSRKQILQPEILDLNDLVMSMKPMLRSLIRENIDLVIVTQPELGLIHADPGQIQQIIMNLAVNARDAMLDGGKLTIETVNVELDEEYVQGHLAGRPGPYIMLAISDNGIGMDAETKARLFEPFFTTKEKGKGTGLGLSTIYGIVKQSNGFIWVYSEPGKGTTFKIYFPRAEGIIEPAPQEKTPETKNKGNETILVVEDDHAVRALTSRILCEHGYAVLEASNGMEAAEIAQRYSGEIHLVITDVVMPGISGRELEAQLKKSRLGIKTIFVSGYTDNAIVHNGILESNIDFLQKPFSVDSLLRKVRQVLDT